MRIAILAVLVVLSTPAFADRASEDGLLARARSTYLNDPAMEKNALAASQGRATRNGEALLLRLAGSKPLRLASNTPPCADTIDLPVDACLQYSLVADLPSRHAYLVAKSGYEGCADLLLIDDRSGRRTNFADVPVFSPDGERLLIQNECEADGSASNNHLEIWRRQSDRWVLEWAYTDEQAYAADPALKSIFRSHVLSWQGDRIALTFSDSDLARHWSGTLTRRDGHWVLQAGKLASP